MCHVQLFVFAVVNFFVYYVMIAPGMPCTITFCPKED